jgi:hypothetical protein
MSDDRLMVDLEGFEKIINQVNQICELVSRQTAGLSVPIGTGQNVYCDAGVTAAASSFLSAWTAENTTNVDALTETSRKLRETKDRYQATDGAGAQEIDVSVQQAGQA